MASNLQFFQGDCLDILPGIPENSIGHINCDPPYNIGAAEWDRRDEYLTWCYKWVKECVRVLAPNRMLIIWGTFKNDDFLRMKLGIQERHKELYQQNCIIWSYNWGGRTKSNFPHKFEAAWCFSKGREFLFDERHIKVERKMKRNIRTGKEYKDGTIPTNVWAGNLATVSKEAKESAFHPTVKPQFVLKRMILAYTKPRETVLDPFSGSGSTAVAALATHRDFIGCEKNKEYIDKSLERIKK